MCIDSTYMCICTHMYTVPARAACMYVCIYMCIDSTYMCMCTYMYTVPARAASLYVCVYIHVHIDSIHMYTVPARAACMYVCIYTCTDSTYPCTCTYMHTVSARARIDTCVCPAGGCSLAR